MINRSLYTPDGSNPPWPVPVRPNCTVPTRQMAETLADLLETTGDVLEIGTGSGYQTAILAERCRSVVTIEVEPIPDVDSKLPSNVVAIHGNGFTHDTETTYDAILVTCAAHAICPVWDHQLKEGGRLIVPIGEVGGCAAICVFQKIHSQLVLLDIPCYAPFTAGVTA